jgi:hypothetical protein
LNVPSFSVLWQQNKAVFKKHGPDLALFSAIALGVWLLEILYQQYSGLPLRITSIPILRGLPLHYLPEWVAFFCMGRFACDFKTSLISPLTYLFILFGLLLSVVFFVSFIVPSVFGNFVQRVINQRSRQI